MQVIYRWWKVTLRKDVPLAPGERKNTYEDFLIDDRTKGENCVDACTDVIT